MHHWRRNYRNPEIGYFEEYFERIDFRKKKIEKRAKKQKIVTWFFLWISKISFKFDTYLSFCILLLKIFKIQLNEYFCTFEY